MAGSSRGPGHGSLAVLGLGSNLPDRERWLDLGTSALLGPAVELVCATPRWNTVPRGAPPQPDYLNQLLLLRSELGGSEWLLRAEAAELLAGRRRGVAKGPRTLDVDVLLVEGERSATPRLTLPHPAILERPHLLAGAAAMVPSWRLPGYDMPISEIARMRLEGCWAGAVELRGGGGRREPE
jgi:2-amino-4-hydroxy-6-hydroxymethyldihydropteridine diphosphokinase